MPSRNDSRHWMLIAARFALAFCALSPATLRAEDCNGNGVEDAMGIDPANPDGDGVLDVGDLPGFVALLLESADCALADVNQDGAVDGRDVEGFVALLLGA